jgi:predicted Rdx family selenoprotein
MVEIDNLIDVSIIYCKYCGFMLMTGWIKAREEYKACPHCMKRKNWLEYATIYIT